MAGGNVALGIKTTEFKKPVEKADADQSSVYSQTKKKESFLASIKAEFMKITWTPKDELIAYTKIVLGATFLCGMGVYLMDLFIQMMLSGVEVILKLIFG